MAKPRIRPIAIGIFRHADSILVSEGRDPARNLTFYRPLGGAIRFGETSEAALRREIREELGSEIGALEFLGVQESIFEYRGVPCHELVMVYRGCLLDENLYGKSEIVFREGKRRPRAIRCRWLPLKAFQDEGLTLFPQGVLELLGRFKEER